MTKYILEAFEHFTFFPKKIEVDNTNTIEQSFKNIGEYFRKIIPY